VTAESAHVLSIGSMVGGATPENKAWRDALSELTTLVRTARAGVDAPLNLNVVFHVPGNLLQPDFSGVRTGRFSRKNALLMVQVALPSEAPNDALAYLRAAVLEAIAEAARWADKKRVPIDVEQLESILSRA
jgi:hypothetical protein